MILLVWEMDGSFVVCPLLGNMVHWVDLQGWKNTLVDDEKWVSTCGKGMHVRWGIVHPRARLAKTCLIKTHLVCPLYGWPPIIHADHLYLATYCPSWPHFSSLLLFWLTVFYSVGDSATHALCVYLGGWLMVIWINGLDLYACVLTRFLSFLDLVMFYWLAFIFSKLRDSLAKSWLRCPLVYHPFGLVCLHQSCHPSIFCFPVCRLDEFLYVFIWNFPSIGSMDILRCSYSKFSWDRKTFMYVLHWEHSHLTWTLCARKLIVGQIHFALFC